MKRLVIAVALATLIGCASMRNTVNRLQGDVEYFRGALSKYSTLLKAKDLERANRILSDAEKLFAKAEKASHTGDKISEKKYLSALVDIMDLLAEYDK